GYNIAHNTEDNIFDELSKDPARARRFAGAMGLLSLDDGYSPRHLVDNYPWASIGEGTVVDVGGSHGSFSFAIAQAFPLTCIVQDKPEVLADLATVVPTDLKDRLKFMAHDFFAEQPVHNADVYLFRWIFHDWPDKYSIRILKALIPALKEGARIVIHEYVLPEPGAIPLLQERQLRLEESLDKPQP
ncbi:MAG: hypothetical protein Q9187_008747, partial [Circinaria calcarea]